MIYFFSNNFFGEYKPAQRRIVHLLNTIYDTALDYSKELNYIIAQFYKKKRRRERYKNKYFNTYWKNIKKLRAYIGRLMK